ncbi:glycoside hydrolase family 3 protein [Muriicola soli]|uniref:beta-N-acetylhexosaminidase n=1 Tax=Muriicola soli TaxID=2507538 RepID=A0A411E9Z9_9FLAO|nr:glycoside hydrolase family 3 N-terminal domain-containing protein [Muriicola soli]QBA64555.1 glycoside hydrolase family 3 protein [Muriicola soli]
MGKNGQASLGVIPYAEATKKLTLKEKVGQFFMPAAFINDTEEEILALQSLVSRGAVGGICFFHSRASAATNFEGKKEVVYNAESFSVLKGLIQRYQRAAKYPLLISIDAEWGLAMRIEETPQYPYAITLGAANDPLLIYEIAKTIGSDCRIAGIHWNFAPVADINSNPDNPVIGYRSFGGDKEKVSVCATAFSKGLQDAGILSCAKHFPGHGDTATDSHLQLPVIDKTKTDLLKEELVPFKALIRNGVDAIMVGHISLPEITDGQQTSASVSKHIIGDLLLDTLNYKGVVVSDALNMRSVSNSFNEKGMLEWAAFNAGTDVLCFAENVVEGIEQICNTAEENQIEASFKKVWTLKEKGINKQGKEAEKLSSPLNLNERIARKSLTLFRGTEAEIQKFREDDFNAISIGADTESQFLKKIGWEKEKYFTLEENGNFQKLKNKIGSQKQLLLAVYLPTAKPVDAFGLGKGKLEILIELLSHYDSILYLFGNPYFLRLLPIETMKGIVIAYQHLDGFEMIAAEHFLGNFTATGYLPVKL